MDNAIIHTVIKLKSKICIINCKMEWFAAKNNKISDKNK